MHNPVATGKWKRRKAVSNAGLGAVTGVEQVTCCSLFCAFLQTACRQDPTKAVARTPKPATTPVRSKESIEKEEFHRLQRIQV